MVFQLLRTRSAPASPKTEAKKETQGTTQAIMNLGVNRIPRTASNVSSAWRNARRSLNGRQSSRGSCSRRSKRSSKSRGTNSLFRAVSSENWELVISICEAKPYKAESWHSAPGFFDGTCQMHPSFILSLSVLIHGKALKSLKLLLSKIKAKFPYQELTSTK